MTMKRGQYFVRAKLANGEWGNVDILDLDETSFRAFLIDRYFADDLVGILPDFVEGEEIAYQEKTSKEG